MMKKFLSAAALAVLFTGVVAVQGAQAALISVNGSASLGVFGATTISGTDLSNPGTLTLVSPFVAGGAIGDHTGISSTFLSHSPFLFTVGAGTLTPASFNITGPASFGSFTATGTYTIVSQTASFLEIYLEGIFTPGSAVGTQLGGCATGGNTCDATLSSMRWSFNQSGNSVSGSATFNSPAAGVPEPASLALMGVGLAVAAYRRRKQ